MQPLFPLVPLLGRGGLLLLLKIRTVGYCKKRKKRRQQYPFPLLVKDSVLQAIVEY